jgi:hypothetical protein
LNRGGGSSFLGSLLFFLGLQTHRTMNNILPTIDATDEVNTEITNLFGISVEEQIYNDVPFTVTRDCAT